MTTRIDEHDEFLLSRLLDGDLATDEALALRRRMEQEPALQEAYDALARVDAALRTRQADRPVLDWGRFHREVMDRVQADAAVSHATLQLRRWIRLGVPLAAAAAIVLLVSVYPFGTPTSPTGTGAGPDSAPPEGAPGTMVVRLGRPLLVEPTDADSLEVAVGRHRRPEPDATGRDAPVQVTFVRSERLREAVEREDETVRTQSGVAIAGNSSPLPIVVFDEFMGEPPL